MKFKTTTAALGTAAAALLLATAAHATPIYPVFTVDPAGAGNAQPAFVANDISFAYYEVLTFTSATAFQVSLLANFTSYQYKDTVAGLSTSFAAAQSGLGATYGMVALFQATGTYTLGGGGPQLTVDPGGSFNLYLTSNPVVSFTAPATAASPYTLSAGSLTTIATGAALNGVGTPAFGPNLTGAFGQTTSFGLTAAGSSYFTQPIPFYDLNLQSGQLQSIPISVGATTSVTGSGDAIFIPEPSGVALVGVALIGAGIASRRKTRKA